MESTNDARCMAYIALCSWYSGQADRCMWVAAGLVRMRMCVKRRTVEPERPELYLLVQ